MRKQEFMGLAVGGPLSGAKLWSHEPTKVIAKLCKLEMLPPPTLSAETAEKAEAFRYVFVPGLHGLSGGHHGMFENFWVPEDRAVFKNGKWVDNGWAAHHILTHFYDDISGVSFAEMLRQVKGELESHKVWNRDLSSRLIGRAYEVDHLCSDLLSVSHATFWQRLKYLFTGDIARVVKP